MNPLKALTSYLQGVQAELRKVVWPTRATLISHFSSVVIGLLLATIFIGGIDYLFIHALGYLIKAH